MFQKNVQKLYQYGLVVISISPLNIEFVEIHKDLEYLNRITYLYYVHYMLVIIDASSLQK